MKYINLYQAAFHPPRVVLPARQLLLSGAVFLGALVALYAWDTWRLARLRQEVSQLADQATKLETRLQAMAAPSPADPKVLAETMTVETRLRNLQLAQEALAGGALGAETGYSAQFRALARVRVPGAWLTRVEIGEGGHEMNLQGRALSGEDSARLIAGLRREPLFVGLSFASLNVTPPEADKDSPEESASARAAAKAPAAAPPRYLQFALSARLAKESATPAAAAVPGLPANVNIPEQLLKQAAQAQARSTP